jgi:predicted O-methyltransferase YrrM
MAIDLSFLQSAGQAFDPFVPAAGTEHMAPLLYSLARMVRPATVVEFGSGYTTLFLLRALADNLKDIQTERTLLREKSLALMRPEHKQATRPEHKQTAFERWFATPGKACAADPSYYLKPYLPHLYSFEKLSEGHPYSRKVVRAVTEIGHISLFTHIHGEFSADALPDKRIDLAWNDDREYAQFFEACWPRLNESGGLLIFHNVPAVEELWRSIEWMQSQRAAQKDLEVLILHEPHKLNQNGCAILRRNTNYQPSFRSANFLGILHNLARFMSETTN